MSIIKRGRPKKEEKEKPEEKTEERKDFECPECTEEFSLDIDEEDDLEAGVLTDCPACKTEITLYEADLKDDDEDNGDVDEEPVKKTPKKKLPEMPNPSVAESSQMSNEEMLVVAQDYISRANELLKCIRKS